MSAKKGKKASRKYHNIRPYDSYDKVFSLEAE